MVVVVVVVVVVVLFCDTWWNSSNQFVPCSNVKSNDVREGVLRPRRLGRYNTGRGGRGLGVHCEWGGEGDLAFPASYCCLLLSPTRFPLDS